MRRKNRAQKKDYCNNDISNRNLKMVQQKQENQRKQIKNQSWWYTENPKQNDKNYKLYNNGSWNIRSAIN